MIGGVCHGPLGLIKAKAADGSPLVQGRRILVSSSRGAELLEIKRDTKEPVMVWENKNLKWYFNSGVLFDGHQHVTEDGGAAGPGDGEHVRETGDHQPQIADRTIPPFVLECQAVPAANVHTQHRAGHGVETGGEDDDVEFLLALS